MDYKTKITEWNSTLKYLKELQFLYKLVGDNRKTLDYGCGIGTAMNMFKDVKGYDVNEYLSDPSRYDNEIQNRYESIYFMHSLAHIPNPNEVLKSLRHHIAIITVITPNKDWLDVGYNNDSTVIKHYTQSELVELFKDCGYTILNFGQFGELKNGVNERIFLQAI